MKKKLLAAFLAIFGTTSAFAEGEPETYPVPQAVKDSITQLESAATSYANEIYPYIRNIGLAFVGIAVFYLLFRLWRRFAQGR